MNKLNLLEALQKQGVDIHHVVTPTHIICYYYGVKFVAIYFTDERVLRFMDYYGAIDETLVNDNDLDKVVELLLFNVVKSAVIDLTRDQPASGAIN